MKNCMARSKLIIEHNGWRLTKQSPSAAAKWMMTAFRWAVLMSLGVLGLPTAAWAEGTSGIQGPHGDTMASLLVVLCVALSMILLCRSSGRYAESKLDKIDDEE
jgi:hypothetical protein